MERLKLRARLVERTLDRIEKEKERARRAGARAADAGARVKDAGARAVDAGTRVVDAGADAGRWFAAAPQRLSEMSGEVRDSLRETADDFDAEELWDRILEDVRGKAEDARGAADAAKDRARDAARKAGGAAREGARRAKEKAEQAYGHIKETDLRDRANWNRSRGAKDMTPAELARLRLDNFAVIGVPTGAVVAPLAVVGGIVYLWSGTNRVRSAHRIAASCGVRDRRLRGPGPGLCDSPG